MVILAKTKIADAIKEYPQLKEFLISLSPKFEKLKNPMIFKLVSKWATFHDASRISGLSICELLHSVNRFIGTEEELIKSSPECIKRIREELKKEEKKEEPLPIWIRNTKRIIQIDVTHRDDFFFPEVYSAIKKLNENEVLLIINSFYPSPLISILSEEGYDYFLKKDENQEIFELYIKGNKKEILSDWHKIKENFDVLDVRGWREDPFTTIIKKANETPEGDGFKIIQYFYPEPLINMIKPLGFDVLVEKKNPLEHHVYFYRISTPKRRKRIAGDKIPIVIQSATPIVYPIVMRLLQSKELMDKIKIEELKIWDKTEKHLGWIMSGKADISFSAVAAVSKIYQKGLDIKMKAVVVWDNFFILTRGYKAKSFSELKGKKIYLPLIQSAPPYMVTKYLLNSFGYDEKEFEFVFGEPFGRPSEIKELLVKGEIDTALLREPEASFAIYEGNGDVVESIAYRDLWKKLFPESGNLPNAGILFKGEFLRAEPEVSNLFLEETKKAIKWVNENKDESANIIYDIMGITKEEAKLFLSRATFKFVESSSALSSILNYIDVLNKAGYGKKEFKELNSLFI